MTKLKHLPPVLRHKHAHGKNYGRFSARYMSLVFKWRFHFYGIVNEIRRNAGALRPPFDFQPLEKYLSGFTIEYRNIADLPADFLTEIRAEGEVKEGWHYIDGTNGIIYIFFDPTVSSQRQRFTIAHEFGHVLQELDGEFKADIEAMPDAEERQGVIESVANHIAAYYLVPHGVLKREMATASRIHTIEAFVIDRLAQRFHVSQAVITNSFMNARPRLQIR